MTDVTPEQARDFYRAAASFYRRAPWRSAGEGEVEPILLGDDLPQRRERLLALVVQVFVLQGSDLVP